MKTILLNITLPLILVTTCLTLSASVVLATTEENQTTEVCDGDIDVDLQGQLLDKNNATVTNFSKNKACEYDATLVKYEAPQEENSPSFIDSQVYITHKTVKVASGKTETISLEGDSNSCRVQTDLIRGNRYLEEKPYYAYAMDAKVYTVKDCGEVVVTPTPTPTATTGPTSTPTPGPTSTPGPGPTATPALVTGQVGGAHESLASTGNAAFIYSVIIAGAISLISGLVLKKLSKS